MVLAVRFWWQCHKIFSDPDVMFRVRGLHSSPPRGAGVPGRLLLLLLAPCLIAGCQGLATDWQTQPIAASEAPLLLEDSDFDPVQATHLVERDPRSGNRLYVSRFSGAEAVAVLAALKTGPGYVVEERAPESYVADLLAKPEPELVWGESGRAPSRLGGRVPYRMFRIDAQSLSCVGFGQPLGESADDRGRKRDLVFGYFCRVEAQPLSAAAAEELIAKVALAGRP